VEEFVALKHVVNGEVLRHGLESMRGDLLEDYPETEASAARPIEPTVPVRAVPLWIVTRLERVPAIGVLRINMDSNDSMEGMLARLRDSREFQKLGLRIVTKADRPDVVWKVWVRGDRFGTIEPREVLQVAMSASLPGLLQGGWRIIQMIPVASDQGGGQIIVFTVTAQTNTLMGEMLTRVYNGKVLDPYSLYLETGCTRLRLTQHRGGKYEDILLKLTSNKSKG
jgi:hypothetical protein